MARYLAQRSVVSGLAMDRGLESIAKGELHSPLSLLPSQMYGTKPRVEGQPERRLMLAVLEDALVSFMKTLRATDPRATEMRLDVVSWFQSRDVAWPFSFERICEALDLDADWIRGGLNSFRERAAAHG